MSSEETLAQMQREWRQTVLDNLSELKRTVETIRKEMHDFRLTVALHADVVKLDERVGSLEKDKMKLIGAVVVLNALLALIPLAITWFGKKP